MKWLAPEVLRSKSFTTMSDVWAFGVMVWEVLTRGLLPYGTLNGWNGNFQDLKKHSESDCDSEIKSHLDAGNRLEKPAHCDDQLYDLLLRCWHDERRHRPKFSDLAVFFKDHYRRLNTNVSFAGLKV